jgi:hypothetical protein
LAGGGSYERLGRVLAVVRRQLVVGSRPVWIVSVALVLFTWPLGFGYPGEGLDFSWMAGIYMATEEGKNYGTEVIFTYGPLGFLAWPALWSDWLPVPAYLYYFGALYLSFTALLTWSLTRTVGLLAATVVVFLTYSAMGFLGMLPLLLAVGLAFLAMRADRPAAALPLLVVAGGLLAGLEPLIKLSNGPPTAVIIVLGLIGARPSRRQWAAFTGIAAGSFFAAWFLTGQGLGNLWDYAINGIQIISGYNEAMGFSGAEAWEAVAIVVLSLALVALIHRAEFRDARARLVATLVTAAAAYVFFKYGTTQFAKGGPPVVAMSSLLAVFMLAPWPRERSGAFLAVTTAVAAVTLHAFPATANLDVISKFEKFKDTTELALRPGLRQGYVDRFRADLQATLKLSPQILALLKDKRVAVDPWEISAVWAYELDWQPLPAFQNYTAYTPRLDRLNAAAIEDPDGPQMLLRQVPAGAVPGGGRPALFGRQPVWDPPEQNLATVCHFIPILTEAPWQALQRIPDRCHPPRRVASKTAEPGEAVPVPQAGRNELVVLKLEGAEVEGLEKLASLFWRPDERHAVINDGEGLYRLVPGTSGDGLIVSADPSLDRNANLVELARIKEISIEGADGPLHFDFYRIKLTPLRLVPVN